ncbi:hypothetical protein D3C71_1837480 [compost metagenome]
MAASELATARPRSLWQCALKMMRSLSGTPAITRWNMPRISSGVVKPTVSGRLMVVAPAATATRATSIRKSSSVRVASSAENSTSSM